MKEKTLGWEVMRIHNGLCIVKSWGKKVRLDGVCYGQTMVWYDVCQYEDGELGDCFESFKDFGKAVRYLHGMEG